MGGDEAAPDAGAWNRRFIDEGWDREPSPFLVSLDRILPSAGSALDVAGGPGRNAIWLAGRGLDVTLADFSEVALAMATARAHEAGVEVTTVHMDLAADPLPAGAWDVILCFHFLKRPLFPAMAAALAPGGLLAVESATVRNLERHPRPPRRFVVDEGEAPALVDGLDIVRYEEGWFDDRHVARIAARRPNRRMPAS